MHTHMTPIAKLYIFHYILCVWYVLYIHGGSELSTVALHL